ncbi:MAG: extracellular solute-binding protein [Anaerolineae bacterium]|nr:extracellular solute-binding protein [Anaerolineae bacterium]
MCARWRPESPWAKPVALGEADAGIVYRSDVTPDLRAQVGTLDIPDDLNTIATYPIAITDNPAQPELAQAFIDYVLSDAGQATLVSWNFITARLPAVPDTITLPAAGSLRVDGQVLNPLTLTVADLRQNFAAQTLEVSFLSGEATIAATFTGVPLWQVISAAQPAIDADVPGAAFSLYVVITGADGYQAVLAWAEINPEYGHAPALLAYAANGADIPAGLRLVVPGDARDGRYVAGVVSLSLRAAPAVSR